MITKKIEQSKIDISQLVFTDPDKKRRAEDAYLILMGKNPKEAQMGAEHKAYLRDRFGELIEEEKIDIKDKDAAILFIYKKMGGAVRTLEQQARIRKQGSIFKGKAAKEAAPAGEDEENAGESEDDEDEDDE